MSASRTPWQAPAVCTFWSPPPFSQLLLPAKRRSINVSSSHAFADSRSNPSRHIELDIDIGADAKDWSGIAAAEKLKPVEADLRRMEESVNEIVTEMEYLRGREQKLRDTNESTNERVKWFAFGTMGMLIGLGAWQIVYLRAYFRWVCRSSKLNVIGLVSSWFDC
jgi:emp24/gp25L/p24 family/GOLD